MIFPTDRVFVCKHCGRKINASAGSNLSRLINHLYEAHPKEIEELKDLYLNDVVRIAFDVKGVSA